MATETFIVRVRQYADGKRYALTDYEMSETEEQSGVCFDDVVPGDCDGPYREFDVQVTAEPPSIEVPTVAVSVPSDATLAPPTATAA